MKPKFTSDRRMKRINATKQLGGVSKTKNSKKSEGVSSLPVTVEHKRKVDPTIVDIKSLGSHEVSALRCPPAGEIVMVVCEKYPSKELYDLIKELQQVFPNCSFASTGGIALKEQVARVMKAMKRSENPVVSESSGQTTFAPNTLMVAFEEAKKTGKKLRRTFMHLISLPQGPWTKWEVTNAKLGQSMPGGGRFDTNAIADVMTCRFATMLGHSVAGQLQSAASETKVDGPIGGGRRTIVFHNQRDFVFFRHYKYEITEKTREEIEGIVDEGTDGIKADRNRQPRSILKEVGPSFTMRLMYFRKGRPDSLTPDFEYMYKPDTYVDRAACYL